MGLYPDREVFQQHFPTSPLAHVPQELEVITSTETSTLYLEGHSNFSARGFMGSEGDCHLSPLSQVVACLGADAT